MVGLALDYACRIRLFPLLLDERADDHVINSIDNYCGWWIASRFPSVTKLAEMTANIVARQRFGGCN